MRFAITGRRALRLRCLLFFVACLRRLPPETWAMLVVDALGEVVQHLQAVVQACLFIFAKLFKQAGGELKGLLARSGKGVQSFIGQRQDDLPPIVGC